MQTKQYCSTCKKHTDHVYVVASYATACRVCGSHTSHLVRLQALEATPSMLLTPDGIAATIVDNTPRSVTYYVADGAYKGYYEYDKQTKAKQIRQG